MMSDQAIFKLFQTSLHDEENYIKLINLFRFKLHAIYAKEKIVLSIYDG